MFASNPPTPRIYGITVFSQVSVDPDKSVKSLLGASSRQTNAVINKKLLITLKKKQRKNTDLIIHTNK